MKQSLFLVAIAALSLGAFSACNNAPAAKEESKGTETPKNTQEKAVPPFLKSYLDEVKGLKPFIYNSTQPATTDYSEVYVKITDEAVTQWTFSRSTKDSAYISVVKHEVPIQLLSDEAISVQTQASSVTQVQEVLHNVVLTTTEDIPYWSVNSKTNSSELATSVRISFTDKAQADAAVARINELRKVKQ